jgi:hypothetical protein
VVSRRGRHDPFRPPGPHGSGHPYGDVRIMTMGEASTRRGRSDSERDPVQAQPLSSFACAYPATASPAQGARSGRAIRAAAPDSIET